MIHFSAGEGKLGPFDQDIGQFRTRLRFKVARALGWACPDIDDIVQETLRRYLESVQSDRVRTPEAIGAFLNGVCKNVISEYRRRLFRDTPMPAVIPEPPAKSISAPELFELQDAVAEGMLQLSARDRQVLHMFYLEEKPIQEILDATGLTEANFRVVLCRAKERFRQIYRNSCNNSDSAATT
jgi:RNA polymerase sigma-70 factor (ECF subfamily)